MVARRNKRSATRVNIARPMAVTSVLSLVSAKTFLDERILLIDIGFAK